MARQMRTADILPQRPQTTLFGLLQLDSAPGKRIFSKVCCVACSYHINGFESPLLRVVRGTRYTFNIMVRICAA